MYILWCLYVYNVKISTLDLRVLIFIMCWGVHCFSVKKKAKINIPNRINRQDRAKKETNFCANFQSHLEKGNRSDYERGSCCKKRRNVQRSAFFHVFSNRSFSYIFTAFTQFSSNFRCSLFVGLLKELLAGRHGLAVFPRITRLSQFMPKLCVLFKPCCYFA